MAEDEKKNKLKLASRQLIQILGINPKIPVAIQDKIKDIQTSADAEAKGLPWINQIIRALGKIPHIPSIGTKIGIELGKKVKDKKSTKKLGERAKGGIVQKFSRGGTVERPRGVGIAKRGYGKVMR